ncbi:MAG: aminoacyl-tRNA hydrolase [Candidatus Moeniiplasma glomeromycotorum]|nr:aminoacyl-tRNA hydrolase [Candidatus Moeniiplasma glomeromycotorum]MCE8162366.1 aminoacyl-tRNA hydrolase [Candidatus Moeniiplasma glomeromycotorum]MCE8166290.1 aminoacyl-tRNA hydrolase [Candidatus Moeniiplasma glomeromycotorum]MCE8166772.1 aminoacyl-tRNA hydrolase [Candidatus Moeniiplasma glomeromycotorum]
MKLIVGLGNPGKEYENTRHNLGFWVIDSLAQKLAVSLKQKKFNGLYYQNSEYILLQPQTYMNNSGECVLAFMNYFQIPLANLLVVYDEVALPLGSFRYRSQGSAGGHNGVKNLIEKLGSKNFKRLRVGIGYEPSFTLQEWVLGKFRGSEKEAIEVISPTLLTSLEKWIQESNFEKIMGEYNKKV